MYVKIRHSVTHSFAFLRKLLGIITANKHSLKNRNVKIRHSLTVTRKFGVIRMLLGDLTANKHRLDYKYMVCV